MGEDDCSVMKAVEAETMKGFFLVEEPERDSCPPVFLEDIEANIPLDIERCEDPTITDEVLGEVDPTELEKVCSLRCMEDCDATMPLDRRSTVLEDLIGEEERLIEPEAVRLLRIETRAEVRCDERIIDDLIDKVFDDLRRFTDNVEVGSLVLRTKELEATEPPEVEAVEEA